MNFKQIRNQLRREIKASPVKAGALGLGLCVGMYFWLPMLWGLLPDKAPEVNEEMDHKTLFAKLGTTLEVTTEGTVEQPETPWQELVASIEQDDWMSRDGEIPASARNPFEPQTDEAAEALAEKAAAELTKAAVQLRPDELGFELTGTTIGPRRRLAVINDRVYREGARLESEHGTFILAEVRPSQVILQRGDQSYALEIDHDLEISDYDTEQAVD